MILLLLLFFSFLISLPEQTVPDLMFFENQSAEQYRDDAQMHHFLESNLYRARPRVRHFFPFCYLIMINEKNADRISLELVSNLYFVLDISNLICILFMSVLT